MTLQCILSLLNSIPMKRIVFPFAFGSTLPIISLIRLYFVSGRLAITTQPIKWLQLNNIAKNTKLLSWLDTMDVGLCQTPIHVKPYINSLIKVQTTNRNTKHSLMLACILLRSTHNSWRVQWKQHDSVLIHFKEYTEYQIHKKNIIGRNNTWMVDGRWSTCYILSHDN